MRTRSVRFGGMLLVMVLVLSACSGGGEGNGDGGDTGGSGGGTPVTAETTLRVSAKEFEFDPSTLSAPADTVVAVELTNVGTIEHDLVIDEAGLTVMVSAGETGTGTFELPAGTYTFYCSITGHREAGMEGTLTTS